jgi:hypothetical protein
MIRNNLNDFVFNQLKFFLYLNVDRLQYRFNQLFFLINQGFLIILYFLDFQLYFPTFFQTKNQALFYHLLH